jgi:N-acetylmuramoyl-L-alanine amidase
MPQHERPRTWRRGDSGPAVAQIRSRLARLGLLPEQEQATPSATFDDECDRAVRAFQQTRGLAADGIVGAATYRALDEATWRLGDRILTYVPSSPYAGDDVAALQRRLTELGFDAGRVDGRFGPTTDRALRDFQRNVGLRDDGTCGPSTFKALDRLARTVVGGRPVALRESELLRSAGPRLPGKVVVLDPGHGGEDAGHVSGDLREIDIVTDLATRVEGRLTATGVTAYLTRGPSGALDDLERAAFANTTGADVVISLHVDASPSPAANGLATYYFGTDLARDHHSAAGERLAGLLQREIVARTGLRDCRTHAKTWDLLRYTRMPAVRIELGYLTNPDDARQLADSTFRDTVAEAIVVAVQRLYLPTELDSPTGVLRLAHLVG